MSVAQKSGVSVEESFADDYAHSFDDFVRHVKGQGLAVSDRVMEAAHDRAADRATKMAAVRGYRSVNVKPLLRSCLARSLAKHGF